MKKSFIIVIATILFIVTTSLVSVFAASSHSVASKHSVHAKTSVASSQTHCGATGRNIETGKHVGCKVPFTPVAWTGNDQHIAVPATWSLTYICDGGMLNLYVFDVAGKVTGHPFETLEHRFGTCDNTWHSEKYTMSAATTIAIQTGRTDGFAINVTE